MITVPETLETLRLQVAFLATGTNPIVYFPKNTPVIPKLPQGMKEIIRKTGIFYYNPSIITEKLIDKAIQEDVVWAILGFVQDKKEAIKSGYPVAIVARDANRNEIKTAVVDSNNQQLLSAQAYIFYQFFPNSTVNAETVFAIIAERMIKNGEQYAS